VLQSLQDIKRALFFWSRRNKKATLSRERELTRFKPHYNFIITLEAFKQWRRLLAAKEGLDALDAAASGAELIRVDPVGLIFNPVQSVFRIQLIGI
jgi:hypothetical protein